VVDVAVDPRNETSMPQQTDVETTTLESMIVTRDRGLVTITFNRPAKKNALNRQSWDDLSAVLHEVEESSRDRALMLTGAEGNFSSGADLSGDSISKDEDRGPGPRPIVAEMRIVGDIILRLNRLPKPTLAKIDGVAVGVGLGLALACDLVLVSERARIIEIFPKRGLALDGGNSWLLPRLVGLQKAKELAFFGDSVSGVEAAAIGLANRAVPHEQLDALADEWGHRLADGPTIALSLSKRMLNSSLGQSMEQSLEDEARSQHICYTTQDMREAMIAYMERREPTFEGL
jgi:2-(1,2-epoxy-1,2-dihydrophenyl)acetyl-CoA isomerase